MTAALFLIWSFFAQKPLETASAKPAESAVAGFVLRVEQKKLDVPIPASREIALKKKFFDLVFEFAEPQGVRVAFTFDSLAFVQARNGVPARENIAFSQWETGVMAEKETPGQQDCAIRKDGYHYWFYEHRSKNRFTRSVRSAGKITCFRQIGSIDIDEIKKKLPIAQIDKPLYVIASNADGSQTECLKINWK